MWQSLQLDFNMMLTPRYRGKIKRKRIWSNYNWLLIFGMVWSFGFNIKWLYISFVTAF